MFIYIKAYPCGARRRLTKEYVQEVITTDFGALIKSYIPSRDKLFYQEVFDSKEDIERQMHGQD